jgi:hypothetical protein
MKMTHLVLPFVETGDEQVWVDGLTAWARRTPRIQGSAMFLTVCWLPESKSPIGAIQDSLSRGHIPFLNHRTL